MYIFQKEFELDNIGDYSIPVRYDEYKHTSQFRQGENCVGHAIWNTIEIYLKGKMPPTITPRDIYDRARLIGNMPAGVEGANLKDGAEACCELLSLYDINIRWCSLYVDDVLPWLAEHGPVATALKWPDGFNTPGLFSRIMRPSHSSIIIKKHAVSIIGYEPQKKDPPHFWRKPVRCFVVENSTWSDKDVGYINIITYAKYLQEAIGFIQID